MNFVLVPSRYGDVVPTLKAAVPAFVSSEAYSLHEGQIDDLPGIVLATFAGFLGGVAEADPDSPIVADGLAVIADMLAWNDSETTAAIRDAFFEMLTDEGVGEDQVLARMPADVRAAYDRWRRQLLPR